MNMNRLLGGASSFVHFAGIGLGTRRAEDPKDDEPKGKKSKAADPEDDDEGDAKGKKSKAEEPKDDDEPKGKKSKAADPEDDEDDPPKSKKSRRADEDDDENCDDDDDKDEMHGRSAVANARRRERSRCAAILGSTHAAGNVDLAASLAFNTTMTRKEAVAVLQGTAPRDAQAGDDRSSERRARNPNLGPSGERAAGGQAPVKALWSRAMTKAGVPEKKTA